MTAKTDKFKRKVAEIVRLSELASAELMDSTVIGKDEWRVYKRADYHRVLPRDVHEVLESVEMFVANILGTRARNYSHGRSVEVLTILTHYLDEAKNEPPKQSLREMAEDWSTD
jgi:hypothetical protein